MKTNKIFKQKETAVSCPVHIIDGNYNNYTPIPLSVDSMMNVYMNECNQVANSLSDDLGIDCRVNRSNRPIVQCSHRQYNMFINISNSLLNIIMNRTLILCRWFLNDIGYYDNINPDLQSRIANKCIDYMHNTKFVFGIEYFGEKIKLNSTFPKADWDFYIESTVALFEMHIYSLMSDIICNLALYADDPNNIGIENIIYAMHNIANATIINNRDNTKVILETAINQAINAVAAINNNPYYSEKVPYFDDDDEEWDC